MARFPKSRLSRRFEEKSKKTLITSILGIGIILFLLFKLGIPLLINFSLFISGVKSSGDIVKKESSPSFVSPPSLDPTSPATNSATVVISGSAIEKQTIKLYVNDDLVDTTEVKRDGTFTFDRIELPKKENTVKAKATANNKESDFSNTLTIAVKKTPPNLTIDKPSEGQTFEKDDKTVTVSGKTDPGVRVTVNDFLAIVDGSGNYSYSLTLKDGENKIKVAAVDDAGNKTEQERTVRYAP